MEKNKLLLKQLQRMGLSEDTLPSDKEKWQALIKQLNNIFNEADQDRYLLQRSVELSSEEMQELYNKYAFAQSVAHIAYFEHDLNTHKSTWTNELNLMVGRTANDHIPINQAVKLIHPEDKPTFKKLTGLLYSEGKMFNTEIRLRNMEGKYTWYEIIGKPKRDENGIITGMEGTIHDIQQYKDNEEKIITLQSQIHTKEKFTVVGQLAAGVAHEINNPLSYIMSNYKIFMKRLEIFENIQVYIENLLQAVEANNAEEIKRISAEIVTFNQKYKPVEKIADIKDLLSECSDGLIRIRDIVSELKIFTSSENKAMRESDLNQCILLAIETVSAETKSTCIFNKLSELPLIQGYPHLLTKVIENLLLNAVQAVQDKGVITVETFATSTNINIIISDTGCGIDPENLNKLFTPFYTTRPVGSGKGMGLAACYGIIKLHAGTISVTSELNEGTIITIELPLTSTPESVENS